MTDREGLLARVAADGPGVALAAMWLVLVDLGLTALGHVRLQRLLRRLEWTAASPANAAEALAHTTRAFRWVSNRYPRQRRCLAQAIALQSLLSRRGIPAEVRIGVRRDGSGIRGHAWVEVQGRPLAQRADPYRRFAALRSS